MWLLYLAVNHMYSVAYQHTVPIDRSLQAEQIVETCHECSLMTNTSQYLFPVYDAKYDHFLPKDHFRPT